MTALARRVFWAHTLRWTLALLALWLLANLLLPWFAPDLNRWQAFSFPLGYWLVAEGALLLYLAIVVVYAVVMDRLESRCQPDVDGSGADDAAAGPDAHAAPGAGPA